MERNNQPLVSVVIPCYNHEKFVQDCIQSVIDQTYDNIELIIIDDGSKDNSVKKIQQMISECEKRFIRFEFRTRPNKGLSSTLNEALEWCKGEFYSAIASDDMMLKSKIEKQVNYLFIHHNVVALFGAAFLINDENEYLGELKIRKTHLYDFNEILMHKHHCIAPTQIIRLAYLKEVGGYQTGMIIEDWYMWLKLAKIGKLLVVPDFFAQYRQHDTNTFKQLDKMHRGRFEVISFFKDNELYEDALKNVLWINKLELAKYSNNKIKNMLKIFLTNPKRSIFFILGKIFIKIR